MKFEYKDSEHVDANEKHHPLREVFITKYPWAVEKVSALRMRFRTWRDAAEMEWMGGTVYVWKLRKWHILPSWLIDTLYKWMESLDEYLHRRALGVVVSKLPKVDVVIRDPYTEGPLSEDN